MPLRFAAKLCLPAFVSQSSNAPNFASSIGRMLHPVHDRHLGEIERADVFQTCNVNTVLVRIRAPLVMCVDAAPRTKEMLGFAQY